MISIIHWLLLALRIAFGTISFYVKIWCVSYKSESKLKHTSKQYDKDGDDKDGVDKDGGDKDNVKVRRLLYRQNI